MRLPSKLEIDTKKSQEQAQAVQEALKLTRRVDALRETEAEEAASLERFRTQTLSKIHEETTEAAKERDRLKSEVASLKKDREDALKPLDEEHEALSREREGIQEARESLERDALRIHGIEAAAAEERELASRNARTATDNLERSTSILAEAENKRKEAVLDGTRAQKSRSEAESLVNEARTKLEQVLATERANELRYETRDKEQDARERELNARETRLHDREQTLARNLTRVKK